MIEKDEQSEARTMQELFRVKSETYAKVISAERFQRAEVGTHNGVCLEIAALKKRLEINAETSKEKTERKEAEKERQGDEHSESLAKEQDVHNANFAKEQNAHDASFAKGQDEQLATPATAISVLGNLDQNKQRKNRTPQRS